MWLSVSSNLYAIIDRYKNDVYSIIRPKPQNLHLFSRKIVYAKDVIRSSIFGTKTVNEHCLKLKFLRKNQSVLNL